MSQIFKGGGGHHHMDTLHLTQAGGSCLCWRVANISIKNTIEKDRNVFVSIHPTVVPNFVHRPLLIRPITELLIAVCRIDTFAAYL